MSILFIEASSLPPCPSSEGEGEQPELSLHLQTEICAGRASDRPTSWYILLSDGREQALLARPPCPRRASSSTNTEMLPSRSLGLDHQEHVLRIEAELEGSRSTREPTYCGAMVHFPVRFHSPFTGHVRRRVVHRRVRPRGATALAKSLAPVVAEVGLGRLRVDGWSRASTRCRPRCAPASLSSSWMTFSETS